MGKITDFSVTYGDKQNPVYRPGDTIFGKITFTVSGEVIVYSVKFYCYGAALTKWATSDQRLSQRDSRAKEEYIAKVHTFFGGNGEQKKLAEGTHAYNYRFEVPKDNIPSSFEGDPGAIRYWFKFHIHKPFPGLDFEKLKPFTILSDLDVNKFTTPVSRKDSKTISKALGLGNAGELLLSVTLDRSAYCPGEQMLFNLEANNKSTKDLGVIRIRLVQRAWFSIGTENEAKVTVVKSVVMPKKLAKQDKIVMTKHAVDVPPIPPTTTERSCHIIDVKYFVEVEVEVPLGFDLTIKIPVQIGTIPFGAKRLETKKQHVDCKNYNRIGFTKSITYKTCVAGIDTCIKTDSDLPFPCLAYTPLTPVVTPSSSTPVAKPKATTNPATANKPSKPVQPANAAQKAKPQATTAAKTTQAATPPSIPTAVATQKVEPTAPPVPWDVPEFDFGTIAAGGAMAMPFPTDAPPSYDSIYDTAAVPPSISSPSTSTNNVQGKGSPQAAPAQSEPKKTPNAAASLTWKGATIWALFPDTYLPQMKDFVKKNPKMLDANDGKVVGFFEKFQMSPSESTSAVFVLFNCEENATQWAEHLSGSNPVPELQIFLSVNSSLNAADLKNLNLFPHVQVSMAHRDPTIPITKEQVEQLRVSSKALFPSLRIEYGGKSLIIATKVKVISGDWTLRAYSPDNVVVAVSLWPSKALYDAYIKDLKSKPDYEKFNEVYLIRSTSIISVSTTVFDIEE